MPKVTRLNRQKYWETQIKVLVWFYPNTFAFSKSLLSMTS